MERFLAFMSQSSKDMNNNNNSNELVTLHLMPNLHEAC